jgi:hypothetical protein
MVIYKRALSASLLAPLVIAGVVGCSTQPREPSKPHSTSASSPVVVITEQEALDAAQKAYGEYLAMSDLIAQEGGVNPERLKPLVSEGLLGAEESGFLEISSNGWHAEGNSRFDRFNLQVWTGTKLTSYLCIDHSDIRLLDINSVDVTNPSRIDRYPLQITFAFEEGHNPIIESSETWTGENYC